ncbi:hypothetical protein ABZ565_23125 [Streptomyces sp. NPDC016469]|uniref:hypothetical protein n=1 Tax=Streptomyces sp. NPDC016469 TaxID=3157191 RepID=UPI0034037D9E
MSNDQQHPYHPGGQGPEQQPPYGYGQDPQQYPYGADQPGYGQDQPGCGQDQPGCGQDPSGYGQDPSGYGYPPQQAYPQQAHPQPPQPQQAYGEPAYGGQGYPDASAGQPDQGAAQTWQGQTWDTQYQPTVRRPDGPAPQGEHAVPATGSHPLPPEVHAEPAPPAPAPAPAAPAADGYSAPTTLGNARITDAQRARAEGRSPIIAPGIQPAAITAVLGLLLALGAAVGSYALLVPLVLLQAVTAAGWFRLNGMWPARQGIALAFAGGLVADVALLAAGREHGPAAIIGTLGVWVLLTVVLQLRSRAGADERMQGLMATVASAALAVLAAGHLAAVPDAVTVGAVAVAAAVLVRALPLPAPVSVVAALAVAAGAGAVAGAATDLGAKGALLGLAAGVCALVGLRVASYDYPSRFVHMTAGVALPLTAAAPAVYVLGRVLT